MLCYEELLVDKDDDICDTWPNAAPAHHVLLDLNLWMKFVLVAGLAMGIVST